MTGGRSVWSPHRVRTQLSRVQSFSHLCEVPSGLAFAVYKVRSHVTQSCNAARDPNEPAGQIASRELAIVRIKGALQRTEEFFRITEMLPMKLEFRIHRVGSSQAVSGRQNFGQSK
jgi:hypothetical protein